MRILVTGGAGFIGSHVVEALVRAGHLVCVLDNISTGNYDNIRKFLNDGGTSIYGDIAKIKDVERAFVESNPNAVVHLAAQSAITTSANDPCHDLNVNGMGTLRIIRAALEFGTKQFIFASTSAVYDELDPFENPKMKESHPLKPSNPYGISKLAAEGYVRTMFANSTILRFGNVYGPRQYPLGENQVIARMIRHFEFGNEFYIHGSGNQRRDFVYVSDVVDAVVASLEGELGTYNISTAKATSVNEINVIVRARYDRPGALEHTNKEDPRSLVCMNNSLAKEGLGWEPKVDIYDGINHTIDWWKAEKAK